MEKLHPRGQGETGTRRGPSYEASVMGRCRCEARDRVVDGFLWAAGGMEDPEYGREWGCGAAA